MPVSLPFVTVADYAVIVRFARRAAALDRLAGQLAAPPPPAAVLNWVMDFIAVHANGTPLRLGGLAAAADADFARDAFGIRHHLDRDTDRLRGGFTPRFAAAAADAAAGTAAPTADAAPAAGGAA